MASETEATCVADPNFAVICSFLERFAESCGISHPNFSELQQMLENVEEVDPQLVDLHVKLLRKTRKSFSAEKWEKAMAKFGHTYSQQDGWEVERFGYKKATLATKLRLLKGLLEAQFDLNIRFKAAINKLTASELRTAPLGRDFKGQVYWCQQDAELNLRIYQEDEEEQSWSLIAKDRDSLAELIAQLSQGQVDPADLAVPEDIEDEELSSNSADDDDEPDDILLDTGQPETAEPPGTNGHLTKDESDVENGDTSGDSKLEENNGQTIADIDTHPSSDITGNTKDKDPDTISDSSQEKGTVNLCTTTLTEPLGGIKRKFQEVEPDLNKKLKPDDVSEAIEDPPLIIACEGSGADCNDENPRIEDKEEPEFGEEVEEEVMFFVGVGSGVECDTGNPGEEKNKEDNKSSGETAGSSTSKTVPGDSKLLPGSVDKNAMAKNIDVEEKSASAKTLEPAAQISPPKSRFSRWDNTDTSPKSKAGPSSSGMVREWVRPGPKEDSSTDLVSTEKTDLTSSQDQPKSSTEGKPSQLKNNPSNTPTKETETSVKCSPEAIESSSASKSVSPTKATEISPSKTSLWSIDKICSSPSRSQTSVGGGMFFGNLGKATFASKIEKSSSTPEKPKCIPSPVPETPSLISTTTSQLPSNLENTEKHSEKAASNISSSQSLNKQSIIAENTGGATIVASSEVGVFKSNDNEKSVSTAKLIPDSIIKTPQEMVKFETTSNTKLEETKHSPDSGIKNVPKIISTEASSVQSPKKKNDSEIVSNIIKENERCMSVSLDKSSSSKIDKNNPLKDLEKSSLDVKPTGAAKNVHEDFSILSTRSTEKNVELRDDIKTKPFTVQEKSPVSSCSSKIVPVQQEPKKSEVKPVDTRGASQEKVPSETTNVEYPPKILNLKSTNSSQPLHLTARPDKSESQPTVIPDKTSIVNKSTESVISTETLLNNADKTPLEKLDGKSFDNSLRKQSFDSVRTANLEEHRLKPEKEPEKFKSLAEKDVSSSCDTKIEKSSDAGPASNVAKILQDIESPEKPDPPKLDLTIVKSTKSLPLKIDSSKAETKKLEPTTSATSEVMSTKIIPEEVQTTKIEHAKKVSIKGESSKVEHSKVELKKVESGKVIPTIDESTEVKIAKSSKEEVKEVKPAAEVKPIQEELKKLVPASVETTKVESTKVVPKLLEPTKTELSKVESKSIESIKVGSEKIQPDPPTIDASKLELKKTEPVKIKSKNVDPASIDSAKVELKKSEFAKSEPKEKEPIKIEPKKAEPIKIDTVKEVPKITNLAKAEHTNVVEPTKVDPVKVVKIEEAKIKSKKMEATKAELQTVETEKVVSSKIESPQDKPKEGTPSKVDTVKTDHEKIDSINSEPVKVDLVKANPEKITISKEKLEKIDTPKIESGPSKSQTVIADFSNTESMKGDLKTRKLETKMDRASTLSKESEEKDKSVSSYVSDSVKLTVPTIEISPPSELTAANVVATTPAATATKSTKSTVIAQPEKPSNKSVESGKSKTLLNKLEKPAETSCAASSTITFSATKKSIMESPASTTSHVVAQASTSSSIQVLEQPPLTPVIPSNRRVAPEIMPSGNRDQLALDMSVKDSQDQESPTSTTDKPSESQPSSTLRTGLTSSSSDRMEASIQQPTDLTRSGSYLEKAFSFIDNSKEQPGRAHEATRSGFSTQSSAHAGQRPITLGSMDMSRSSMDHHKPSSTMDLSQRRDTSLDLSPKPHTSSTGMDLSPKQKVPSLEVSPRQNVSMDLSQKPSTTLDLSQKSSPTKDFPLQSSSMDLSQQSSSIDLSQRSSSVDLSKKPAESVDLSQKPSSSIDLSKKSPVNKNTLHKTSPTTSLSNKLPVSSIDLSRNLPQSMDLSHTAQSSIDLSQKATTTTTVDLSKKHSTPESTGGLSFLQKLSTFVEMSNNPSTTKPFEAPKSGQFTPMSSPLDLMSKYEPASESETPQRSGPSVQKLPATIERSNKPLQIGESSETQKCVPSFQTSVDPPTLPEKLSTTVSENKCDSENASKSSNLAKSKISLPKSSVKNATGTPKSHASTEKPKDCPKLQDKVMEEQSSEVELKSSKRQVPSSKTPLEIPPNEMSDSKNVHDQISTKSSVTSAKASERKSQHLNTPNKVSPSKPENLKLDETKETSSTKDVSSSEITTKPECSNVKIIPPHDESKKELVLESKVKTVHSAKDIDSEKISVVEIKNEPAENLNQTSPVCQERKTLKAFNEKEINKEKSDVISKSEPPVSSKSTPGKDTSELLTPENCETSVQALEVSEKSNIDIAEDGKPPAPKKMKKESDVDEILTSDKTPEKKVDDAKISTEPTVAKDDQPLTEEANKEPITKDTALKFDYNPPSSPSSSEDDRQADNFSLVIDEEEKPKALSRPQRAIRGRGRPNRNSRMAREPAAQIEGTTKSAISGRGRGRGRPTKVGRSRVEELITPDAEGGGSPGHSSTPTTDPAISPGFDSGPIKRQSRRIAQLKQKEEEDRKKAEEEALLEMQLRRQAELAAKQNAPPTEESESDSESDSEKDPSTNGTTTKKKRGKNKTKKTKGSDDDDYIGVADEDIRKRKKKKKKRRKKKKKKAGNPWESSDTSDSSSQDEAEEVEDEPEESDVASLKSDHEFSPESDLELGPGEDVQPTRRARTARRASTEKAVKEKKPEVEEEEDQYRCQKCQLGDRPEWILLCDSCDMGWHTDCLHPPLHLVPEGDWLCPNCSSQSLVTALTTTLRMLDRAVRRKLVQEQRKQRLAYVGVSLDNVLPPPEDDDDDGEDPLQGDDVASEGGSDVGDNLDDGDKSSESESSSGTTTSESESDEDGKYPLRQRRAAATVNYNFEAYDELINSAIQDEVEAVKGAGNLGRGKDIATIVSAKEQEEAAAAEGAKEGSEMVPVAEGDKAEEKEDGSEAESKSSEEEEDEEEEEVIAYRKRKKRSLVCLDPSSPEDDRASDEDFMAQLSEEEDDDEEQLDSDSDDSTVGRRRGKRGSSGPVRRSTRARQTRYDREFINDSDSDSDAVKRKKKARWGTDEDISESEMSSESGESDWRGKKKRKRKAPVRSRARAPAKRRKKGRGKRRGKRAAPAVKRRKVIGSDSEAADAEEGEEGASTPVVKTPKKIKVKALPPSEPEEPSRRTTRGRKINYQEIMGSDSDTDVPRGKGRRVLSEEEEFHPEDEPLPEAGSSKAPQAFPMVPSSPTPPPFPPDPPLSANIAPLSAPLVAPNNGVAPVTVATLQPVGGVMPQVVEVGRDSDNSEEEMLSSKLQGQVPRKTLTKTRGIGRKPRGRPAAGMSKINKVTVSSPEPDDDEEEAMHLGARLGKLDDRSKEHMDMSMTMPHDSKIQSISNVPPPPYNSQQFPPAGPPQPSGVISRLLQTPLPPSTSQPFTAAAAASIAAKFYPSSPGNTYRQRFPGAPPQQPLNYRPPMRLRGGPPNIGLNPGYPSPAMMDAEKSVTPPPPSYVTRPVLQQNPSRTPPFAPRGSFQPPPPYPPNPAAPYFNPYSVEEPPPPTFQPSTYPPEPFPGPQQPPLDHPPNYDATPRLGGVVGVGVAGGGGGAGGEEEGEFGGLVSYFSSQREDDLES